MQDPSFDHKTGLVFWWLSLCLEMCSLVCCWLLFSVANSDLSNFLYSAIAPPSKMLAVRRLRCSVESLWFLSTNCDWNWVVLELELILNNSYFYWNYCNPKKREKLLESAVCTWLSTAMKMGKWEMDSWIQWQLTTFCFRKAMCKSITSHSGCHLHQNAACLDFCAWLSCRLIWWGQNWISQYLFIFLVISMCCWF